MVTKAERKLILETVNNEAIADAIIEYLNRNKEGVGYEVFKDERGELNKRIFRFMFNENWTKERFLKYLPFFYYEKKDESKEKDDQEGLGFWSQEQSFEGLLESVECEWEMKNSPNYPDDDSNPNYDELDQMLEESSSKLLYLYNLLYLKEGINCEKIIDYIFENCILDYVSFDVDDWIQYLKLCEVCGINDFFPSDLDYSLRERQEAAGEKVSLIMPSSDYTREGTDLIFSFFHVPVDSDGKPVMRWLGIKVDGNEEIKAEVIENDSFYPECELLRIRSLPDTRVSRYNRQKDSWDVVYNGPRNIDVDFSLISSKRKELKLSQSDVSNAIDVSIRTYQKWESGEVKGISGFFLLRLMRYLNITLDQITIDKGK